MEGNKILRRLLFEARRYFANRWRERCLKTTEPYIDDDHFKKLFRPELGLGNFRKGELIEHFRTREYPKFYFDVRSDALKIKEILKNDFKSNQDEFIAQTKEIRCGKTRLMGMDFSSNNGFFDWHFDPFSGARLPLKNWRKTKRPVYTDFKPLAELNRHGHFPILAKAFFLTEDEEYVYAVLGQWENWMDNNPPEIGINWYESLDIAFRCISWIWTLNLLLQSHILSEDIFLRILKFIYMQANHVHDNLSTYYSPNTHLTGEALALFAIGTWLPELNIARKWQRKGQKILEEQIDLHLDEDGWYREQSTYYHCYTIDIYLEAFILAEKNGVRLFPNIRGKTEKMIEVLMYISRPDRSLPRLGDDDGGKIVKLSSPDYYSYKAALSTGAVLFKRPDFKYVSDGFQEETLWLLGPGSHQKYNEIQAEPPQAKSISLRNAGIHVQRTDWSKKAKQLVFDCGDMGFLSAAHGHADLLNFELLVDGKITILDPGTYRYNPSAQWRNYFRGTSAHNTVTVDDEPQAEFGSMFRWKTKAYPLSSEFVSLKGLDFSAGSHDGYSRLMDPIVHRRSVYFVKPYYWIIRDNFDGNDRHKFTAHFHLNSERVEWDGEMSKVKCDLLDIIPVFSEKPRVEITKGREDGSIRGWTSPVYGERRPIHSVDFKVTQCAPCQFMFVIAPKQGDREILTDVKNEQGAYTVLEIRNGETKDVLFFGNRMSNKTSGDYGRISFEGEMAVIRFINDQITEFGGVNIKRISHDRQDLCVLQREASIWMDLEETGGRK